MDYQDTTPLIHPTMVALSPQSTGDTSINNEDSKDLPAISNLFTVPLPPPPIQVQATPVTENSPQQAINILEIHGSTPIQGSSDHHSLQMVSHKDTNASVATHAGLPSQPLTFDVTEFTTDGKQTRKPLGDDELAPDPPITNTFTTPSVQREKP